MFLVKAGGWLCAVLFQRIHVGCPQPGCNSGGVDVDFDNDCDVDLTDLALLLGDFGCTSGCVADTNGSGTVDLSDLSNLLGRFGNICQ